ncbi:MAG: hypothetical protein LBP37_02295 [Spirochaetaceae bacterium]|jgi:hypothetical protein|nr:hypothetical protein [Spirochaetaceae bacterium]
MMIDCIDYLESLFKRRDFTDKCKKIISVLAFAGLAGCILLLFPPVNRALVEIAGRVKPITSTTWRTFLGSFGIFAALFCGIVLYNIYSRRLSGKVITILLTVFIAGILIFTTYINFVYGRQWIDSDMASEMILGKLLANENRLVTPGWVYSTELRLVYQQLFYMPLFKIFDSWRVVRTITILLNSIVLLAAYFFMMKQLDVSKKTTLVTSMFLILPVSYDHWNIVLFGGYYVFFIAMFFCYIGLSAVLLNFDGRVVSAKKRNTAFIFFALLAFTFGAGGVRGPMDIQVPMFIAALCVYFFKKDAALSSKPVLLSGAGLVLCAAGYVVNVMLHLFFRFLSHHGAHTIDLSGIFFQKLGDILYNFILFLGYTANAKIMAPQGVLNFAIVIIAFLIFYMAVAIIKNRSVCGTSAVNTSFMLFFTVSIVYHVILFQILNEEPFTPHLIPSQILYVPALALIFEFVKKNMTRKKAAVFISAIVFTVLCNGMIRLYTLPESDYNSHRKDSISYIEENDLRFGFASFWNANVITELTNGRIEMLGLDPDDRHRLNVWLYPLVYKNPDYHEGETFLLLTRAEWLADEALALRTPDYEDDDFVIFKYPSAARIFEEIVTVKE